MKVGFHGTVIVLWDLFVYRGLQSCFSDVILLMQRFRDSYGPDCCEKRKSEDGSFCCKNKNAAGQAPSDVR